MYVCYASEVLLATSDFVYIFKIKELIGLFQDS